jgi:hypothetical protein
MCVGSCVRGIGNLLRGDPQFEPLEFREDAQVFVYPQAVLFADFDGAELFIEVREPFTLPHPEETVVLQPGFYRVRLNNAYAGAPLQGRCDEHG